MEQCIRVQLVNWWALLKCGWARTWPLDWQMPANISFLHWTSHFPQQWMSGEHKLCFQHSGRQVGADFQSIRLSSMPCLLTSLICAKCSWDQSPSKSTFKVLSLLSYFLKSGSLLKEFFWGSNCSMHTHSTNPLISSCTRCSWLQRCMSPDCSRFPWCQSLSLLWWVQSVTTYP